MKCHKKLKFGIYLLKTQGDEACQSVQTQNKVLMIGLRDAEKEKEMNGKCWIKFSKITVRKYAFSAHHFTCKEEGTRLKRGNSQKFKIYFTLSRLGEKYIYIKVQKILPHFYLCLELQDSR